MIFKVDVGVVECSVFITEHFFWHKIWLLRDWIYGVSGDLDVNGCISLCLSVFSCVLTWCYMIVETCFQ